MTSETEAITLVVERADGHHTVRAATVDEAIRLLNELEAKLGFTRNSPIAIRPEGEGVTRQVQPAADQRWRCPDHPQRNPRLGNQGGYYHCTARIGEDYCAHRSDRQAAA